MFGNGVHIYLVENIPLFYYLQILLKYSTQNITPLIVVVGRVTCSVIAIFQLIRENYKNTVSAVMCQNIANVICVYYPHLKELKDFTALAIGPSNVSEN
jgi:hypothetical protein